MPHSTPKPGARDTGLQEAHSGNGKNASQITSLPSAVQTYAVTDGRDAIGTIHLIDGRYIATNTHGTIIGTFGSLAAAMRSFRSAP